MDEIGGYVLHRSAGHMPCSELYEAESKSAGTRATVEILRSDLGRAERAKESVGQLVDRLSALEHPHLARCLERLEADGKLAIAFEAPVGPSLRAVLVETGRLPWEVSSAVVAKVARGLAEAHGRVPPLLHLDLRPERVLVGQDGAVKLYGLGLGALGDVLGKGAPRSLDMLRYMSPEHIDGTNVDARSDLYGLGLLLYELLGGHSPFQSSSMRTLVNMQCSEAPVALPDHLRGSLPQGIHALLFQLLEKDPSKRPQTARELFERLEAFLPADAGTAIGRLCAKTAARRSDAPGEGQSPGGAPPARAEPRGEPAPAAERPADAAPAADGARAEPPGEAPAESQPKQPGAAVAAAPPATGPAPPPAPRAGSAERELSVRQALALVIGLTALAALIAYISRVSCSGRSEPPTSTEVFSPPSKPLGTVSP